MEFKLVKGRPRSEHLEQAEFVNLFRKRHPGILIYAIPNGGNRSAAEGQKLKMEGVLPGVPDVFIAKAVGIYHGMYIEMKKTKGGRVSPEQKDVMLKLMLEGFRVEVCLGTAEAMKVAEEYLG